jgi:predicted glycosyltransferase
MGMVSRLTFAQASQTQEKARSMHKRFYRLSQLEATRDPDWMFSKNSDATAKE